MEFYAMKPNFQAMTIKELKGYLLEHRNETEAFNTLMDKIKTDTLDFYSIADVNRFSELLEKSRKTS
jgi:hypothetical protein